MARASVVAVLYRILALAIAGCFAALAAYTAAGKALDGFVYDRAVALLPDPAGSAEPEPQPVLIDIDEQSLATLGRWPWSRQLHADLVRWLSDAGAAAVGYNIAFVEPDPHQAAADLALQQAMAASGRVVSPVFATPTGQEVQPFYASPLAGASPLVGPVYGHVHIEVDDDTIARRVFLYAGVGQPRWPILGLAVRQQVAADMPVLAGRRSPVSAIEFGNFWSQDYEVLIPFKPAGEFRRYAFADVLGGEVPASAFKDRAVFVGLTAAGFEQLFRVYVDGRRSTLSGTEIQAHIYNALQNDQVITVSPVRWSLALAAAAMVWVFAIFWIIDCKAGTQRVWIFAVMAGLLMVPAIALYNGVWLNVMPALAAVMALLCCWAVWKIRLLEKSARRDPMTALANRRMFNETFAEEWAIAAKKKTAISLLLMDVDYFKQFNDHFGHARGDWALIRLAGILTKYSRRTRDLAARYGGEEFAVIFPETGGSQAAQLARELCREVQDLEIDHPGSATYGVLTLSIGVASTVPDHDQRPDSFIHKADLALYRAKSDGRNRVRLADSG